MPERTLQDWLQHWLSQHPHEIEMGLERVRRVWARLSAPQTAPLVFSVAGTNGKGSTVAYLDAILRAAGYRVGRYSSPHLLRYSERIVVDGVEVSEQQLCAAFTAIERARGETRLTYFEAGTLAALLIFAESRVDVAVLEVGLGGRLDAVNLIDADVAIITSIGLDHQEYLGDTLAQIAVEKAGIARAGRPVVVAALDVPAALPEALARIGSQQVQAGRDYRFEGVQGDTRWRLHMRDRCLDLPLPALVAPIQMQNAAAAIVALLQIEALRIDEAAIVQGLQRVQLAARLQRIGSEPEVVLDVAHNPQAAAALRAWLDRDQVPTRAVFGVLADKDALAIALQLAPRISHWHLCGLQALSPRGAPVAALAATLRAGLPTASMSLHERPRTALAAARASALPGERILALGSFFLAAEVLSECAA
jgi:dihydrofolate synthase / folylpolyglutamate synthase